MSDDLLEDESVSTAYLSKGEVTTLAPGTVIQNRYLVERPIGIGGMGAVYLVRDRHFNDVVKHLALKEMIIKLADNFDQQTRRNKFASEANMLALLNHPLIPKVYDFFYEVNRAYLVMEYIAGRDLEDVLLEFIDKGELLDEETVGKWAIQICEVLDHLHSRQPKPIIFRDLKPSNVMLTPQNQTMLIDFGIAKVFEPEQRGTQIGTEGYSPPEQYTGYVEPRSDIYALGAMLHQLLTQSDPQRVTPFTFHERLPRALNPSVSEEMEAIIMKCLAYEIDQRWGSARELQLALERALGVMSITGTGQFRRMPSLPGFSGANPYQNGYGNPGQSNGNGVNGNGHDPNAGGAANPQVVIAPPQGGSKFLDVAGPRWSPVIPDGSKPRIPSTTAGPLDQAKVDASAVSMPRTTTGAILPPETAVKPQAGRAAATPSPDVLWKFETEEEVRSSAALANNTLYIGSYDFNLYALDIQHGQMKWKFATEAGIMTTPACVSDLVIVGSEDHQVYAISGKSGKQEWIYRTWNCVRSSPRIVHDMVVVGSDDGFVHALDLRTSRTLWKQKTWREVRSSAAHYQGIIYIGSDDERIYALEAASGKEKWKFMTKDRVSSSPVISDGLVIIGSMDGHLYALDMNMGWPAWKYRTNDFILASPTVSDGRVFIGSVDHQFHCLDAKTGRPLWRFQTGGQITSTAAAGNGNVYFGCADGVVYCLDARSGQLRWKFQTSGPVASSPLVRDNVLYIGSNDHFVYALKCSL